MSSPTVRQEPPRRLPPPTTEEEATAAVVRATPGVAWLSDSLSAYLPGRTVAGVQMDEHTVRVAIVAQYGMPLADITAAVERALTSLTRGRELFVRIEDLALPGELEPRAVASEIRRVATPELAGSPAPAGTVPAEPAL